MKASGADRALATDEQTIMNRRMAERGGPGRLPSLTETFRRATRLEAAFWSMGMRAVVATG
jgi:thiaminase